MFVFYSSLFLDIYFISVLDIFLMEFSSLTETNIKYVI